MKTKELLERLYEMGFTFGESKYVYGSKQVWMMQNHKEPDSYPKICLGRFDSGFKAYVYLIAGDNDMSNDSNSGKQGLENFYKAIVKERLGV